MTIFSDFDRKIMKMTPVLPINSSIFGQMGMGINGVALLPFLQNSCVYTKTVYYFAGDLTSYSENMVWHLKTISERTHFRKKSLFVSQAFLSIK